MCSVVDVLYTFYHVTSGDSSFDTRCCTNTSSAESPHSKLRSKLYRFDRPFLSLGGHILPVWIMHMYMCRPICMCEWYVVEREFFFYGKNLAS